MEDLKEYVEHLFSKYKSTKEIEELKAEILSNLAARKSDLISQGYSEAEAAAGAKASITDIDGLIDENRRVYKNRFIQGLLQKILFSFGTVFLFTIPFQLFHAAYPIQQFLFWVILITALVYLGFNVRRSEAFWKETMYVRLPRLKHWFRLSLIITSLFILLLWLRITGITFLSPLVNGHAPFLSGSYAVFSLIAEYLLPLSFLVIPFLFHALPDLSLSFEAMDLQMEQEGFGGEGGRLVKKQASRKNLLLFLLLTACLLLFALVTGYTARKEKRMEAARLERERLESSVDTCTLSYILPYKNAYMGNHLNTGSLFDHLPLSEAFQGMELDSDNRITVIRYHAEYQSPGQETSPDTVKAVCYNSAAAFALIDNLEGIRYQFNDMTLETTREKVEEAFGPVASYLTDELWDENVKKSLLDPMGYKLAAALLFGENQSLIQPSY